ncbi:MAG: hypothetical protein EAZ81_12620 [Verrucomicrobia bacterium]|nr:MAG: hypothetical protein EAZ81_12620 [Verrucomicrobiota bacterium]
MLLFCQTIAERWFFCVSLSSILWGMPYFCIVAQGTQQWLTINWAEKSHHKKQIFPNHQRFLLANCRFLPILAAPSRTAI